MLHKTKGLILVISAPAGAGKTTLCKRLLQTSPSFISSVSFTTRPARKREIEGVDYYFVTHQDFQELIRQNALIEWAEVHGYLYGTSKELLKKNIEAGKDVVLEVDVMGGRKIKEHYPQAVLVFILPPSWEELAKRLYKRATENEEAVKRRLAKAREEVKQLSFYDYFLVNDNINTAVQNLLSIIEVERCRIGRVSSKTLEELVQNSQQP